MTTGRPILHRDAYNRPAAAEITSWFAEAIFAPLQLLLLDAGVQMDPRYQAIKYDETGRENSATSALEAGLRSGRVQYADGVFSGKFNSAITRELRDMGANFDVSAKTFRIAPANVPIELRGLLAEVSASEAVLTKQVLETITAAEANVAAAQVGLRLTRAVDAIVNDLGKQLAQTTLSMGPKDVALRPVITPGLRDKLAETYTNNLDLSVKNFASARLPELRRRVEENAFEFGGRTDRLAKIIEAEFGVSKRKAEFLADQETGLLVSAYRAEKYKEMGIREYIWSTSHDGRVRPTHRALDGKKFSFSIGANVSAAGQPARYCNPGQDYRCRCVPRPVINLEEIAAA